MSSRNSKNSRRSSTVRGTVTLEAIPGPLVLATDASAPRDFVSCAHIATTGRAGVHAYAYPPYLVTSDQLVVVTELRALYEGLRPIVNAFSGEPVRVLMDSTDALSFVHSWQQGKDRMPSGYSLRGRSGGSKSTLVKLQSLVGDTPGLTFVHQKAHVGHPLNEVADSLARLGLRCLRGMIPREKVSELLELWASRALDDFRSHGGKN